MPLTRSIPLSNCVAIADYETYRCIGRGVAWMQILRTLVRILQEFQSIELTRGMTDEDMVLVERGALAKPQGGKLWVRFKAQSA